MRELVYNVLISLAWPLLSVYYFLRAHTDGKYRYSFRYRLGLSFPASLPPSRRVWIHALSVGETLSVIPLVQALKVEFPGADIVFSSATETGHSIAQQRLAPWVTSFFFLPHDFPWAVETLIRRVKPDLFILVETDIWPNLVRALKAHRSLIVLVNGRLSERSFARYKRLKSLVEPIFRSFDLVFAQSLEDRNRFLALGSIEGQVHVVGNLKYDSAISRPSSVQIEKARETSGIEDSRPVWVGGSTHEGEEAILLKVHKALMEDCPDLLLILAPRQIVRAPEIVEICEQNGLRVALRSRGQSAEGKGVYILDTLGELTTFYGLSDCVFIGGSLVPFGGHNPLEAAVQQKATCWGPNLSNFREIEADLIDAGCGRVVVSEEDLKSSLQEWLRAPGRRAQMTHAASKLIESHSGCSGRIVRTMREVFAGLRGWCQ